MTQITFGNGDYGVDLGTYGGKQAVYVTPNRKRRVVGERIPIAEQGELVRDTLVDGETVMVFPTREQVHRRRGCHRWIVRERGSDLHPIPRRR